MRGLTRRRFLTVAGLSTGAVLGGCLGEEPEFLVTNTYVGIRKGTGIVVRVTVENITASRQVGRLELVLNYYADGDSSSPDETWKKTDTIEVKKAASPQLQYVFGSAYRGGSRENYGVEATLTRQSETPEAERTR